MGFYGDTWAYVGRCVGTGRVQGLWKLGVPSRGFLNMRSIFFNVCKGDPSFGTFRDEGVLYGVASSKLLTFL